MDPSARSSEAPADDRGVEVEGVGQVQVALDVHRPVVGRPGRARRRTAGRPRPPAGRPRSASGSNLAWASATSRISWRRPDLVRHRRDVGVDEPRGVPGQAHGGVGDHPEPPRLQLTGLQPFPAVREPVEPLHAPAQEPAPGLGGLPQGGGELGDRELRHPRTPGPTQREAGLVPGLHRTDQRVLGVHRRELRRRRPSRPDRPGPRPASGPGRSPAPRPGRHSHPAAGGRESKSS